MNAHPLAQRAEDIRFKRVGMSHSGLCSGEAETSAEWSQTSAERPGVPAV